MYEILKEYAPSFYKQGEVYCAALLCSDIRLPDSQIDELEKRISELSSKLLIFRNQDKGFVLFGREKDDNSLRCLMTDAAVFVNRYIQEQYKTEIAFLIGTNVTDCAGIHFSYEKALDLKEFLYLQRENHLYVWDDYYKSRQEISLPSYENDYEKNVLMAVQSNLIGEIKECVYAVIADARREWYRKPRVISIYQSTLLFVVNAFQKIGIGDNGLFDKARQAVEGLYQSTCITEMMQITLEFLLSAAEIRNADRESYGERQAALAVEYIDRHFDDCDLTMTVLCKKLAISVSYFSTAFKDYTGKTFVEVLTDRRLKEAKMMLSTSDLKTYEIAERCGYRDSSYFSALFKKNTCMTPKEYAKEHRK